MVSLFFRQPLGNLVRILLAHHAIHALDTMDALAAHGRTLSYMQAAKLPVAPQQYAYAQEQYAHRAKSNGQE